MSRAISKGVARRQFQVFSWKACLRALLRMVGECGI